MPVPPARSNLDHVYWHGYWTGPVDWLGLRVLAYQARLCPVPYGPGQNCRASVSWRVETTPLSGLSFFLELPRRLWLRCRSHTQEAWFGRGLAGWPAVV